MNTLKEFFKRVDSERGNIRFYSFFDDSNFVFDNPELPYDRGFVTREELGLFFWERGGKKFVELIPTMNRSVDDIERVAVNFIQDKNDVFMSVYALGFLDALDCLGVEKIKELIKMVEKYG